MSTSCRLRKRNRFRFGLTVGLPHFLYRERRQQHAFGIPQGEPIAARKVAAWMLCERFPYASVTTISRILGYRERSGASHAVAYLERRIASDGAVGRGLMRSRGSATIAARLFCCEQPKFS